MAMDTLQAKLYIEIQYVQRNILQGESIHSAAVQPVHSKARTTELNGIFFQISIHTIVTFSYSAYLWNYTSYEPSDN